MDDPTTWAAPWTIAMPLTLDPQPAMAFECHEGNYGLRNILSAARAADAARVSTSPGPAPKSGSSQVADPQGRPRRTALRWDTRRCVRVAEHEEEVPSA